MLLKGCLHTHTTCSDGEMSPQEVADAYEALGYDFIAFTDHDYLARPGSRARYGEVRSGMIIFTGIELTVFEKGYVHVNRIEGNGETLHVFNHIGGYRLSTARALERLAGVAGRYPINAVEITANGFPDPAFERLDIPLPKLASDDAHGRSGVGRAWIELVAARDRDAILRAVKAGDFWNCYRKGGCS